MEYLMKGNKLWNETGDKSRLLQFYCSACKMVHGVHTRHPSGPTWTWNGDSQKPTFSPSVNVIGCGIGGGNCHLWLRDGKIQYCMDSWHDMRGRTVDLPDFRWGPDIDDVMKPPPDPGRPMEPVPIPVVAAIAEEYGYDQVIVLARRVGEAPDPCGEHMVTYGVTEEHGDIAARAGNVLQRELLGWHKSDYGQ